MESQVDFTPLLVVSVLAVAVPILLHRIPRVAIPIVVGEIVAGMVVGPYGLDLIPGGDAQLEFLKLFGFAYLMFLSGLEIDFDLLFRGTGPREPGRLAKRLLTSPLGAAMTSFSLTLVIALAFSIWLVEAELANNVWVMALILSTTSLGVVVPVLKERGLIRSAMGQYILVASVIGDLATVMLISIYVILHTQGVTFEVLFVLVLLVATFAVYRLAKASQRHLPLEQIVEELSHATAQLDTRVALGLAVVFIALAQGLGVEVILGAFLAGALVSLLSAEEGSVLRPKLNAIGYGFFIPIFFIMVGVDFDLGALESRQGLILVPALVVMAYAVKLIAGLVYKPVLSWRQVLGLGILTSSRLSLIIAVAAIGVEIEAISTTTNAAIILVAIVTVIASPVAFNRLIPAQRDARRRVIIAGSAPHARLLAQRLSDHGELVSVITRNAHLSEEIAKLGLDVILVDELGREEDLIAAGIGEAWAFVSMLADPREAFELTRRVKRDFGIETVVAHVQNPQESVGFKSEGIRVVDPNLSTVIMLEAMVRHPHAFSMLAELDIDSHVADVRLTDPRVAGKQLREIPLPGDALVLAVVRDGEMVIPRGHTRLRDGDYLTLVGSRDDVLAAAAHFRA
jgi:Kef-type K+ transport system membrane component KefB/Trk K+ transport system NAD-binding subunit